MAAEVPYPTVVDILSELVALPSVNPMGGEADLSICFEGRVSDWLEDFFRTIGATYERLEVSPGRDNVIARYDSPGADFTILLDAHQDTVPVAGMTIAPFEPKIADGRLYGRGACDVKGGMAAMLFAFRRLIQEKPAGAANVVLSCTCDEEATIIGITDLVSYWSSAGRRSDLLRTRPDVAVIAEPTGLDVVVAHRGVTRFKIRTKGRACHSSDPTQGINAIYRMAELVSALQEYSENLALTVKAHPLCGSATLSVGKINGGTSVNIVPDECVIEVDRRVTPGEDGGRVVADIREFLASRLSFNFEFDPPWIECGALTDANNAALANAVLACVHAVDGPHAVVGVPYGTHASQTCAAGLPSIVFGPGSIQQAHTRDEFIDIAQLEKAAEVYFQVCINGSLTMLQCTMSDFTAEKSIPRPASARCLLWLLPFSIASALVASARHSHDWAAFSIQAALGLVIVATGYATIALHGMHFEKLNERIAQLFFVATVTICAFVLISRLLFPIPSTPSNEETRINRILDTMLCWPLVVLSFGGIFIAVYSANWKLRLYLLFSVVLMLMIAFSMHGTSRHWLRTLNSFIT